MSLIGMWILKKLGRDIKRGRNKKRKRRRNLSDGKYLQNVLQSTQAGSQKLEFPYTIPPIETVVSLDPETHKTIKVASISLASGIAIAGLSQVVKPKSR